MEEKRPLRSNDLQSRASLKDISEDRHEKMSTTITWLLPAQELHEVIGDKTETAAIFARSFMSHAA